MDKHFPIASFDAIYLIDLCEPLLQVARKRFAKKGWKNITVLCQDASEFSLPQWADLEDSKGSVEFVTMSYSLSMVDLPLFRLSNRLRYFGYRFPIFIPFWIELTTFFLHKPDCLVWLIFIPLESSPHLTRKPLAAHRKNVVG